MKNNVNKVILAVLAVVLVFGCGVGATLAWLQDTTAPVVNTFTEGKVDIDLYETEDGTKVLANSYKMVPGEVLTKDPTVEVLADSEDCWLFVKVEKTANVDTFLTYTIADGWNPLDGVAGVYYRAVSATVDEDDDDNLVVEAFPVLANNQVTVNSGVDMDDMKTLATAGNPKLTFTAYAIQSANIKDTNNNGAADEAWAALNP